MLSSESEGLMVRLRNLLPYDSGGNIVSFLNVFTKADVHSFHFIKDLATFHCEGQDNTASFTSDFLLFLFYLILKIDVHLYLGLLHFSVCNVRSSSISINRLLLFRVYLLYRFL